MYAIVEFGGMQWKVSKSDTLRVPKIDEEPGKTVEIKNVLLLVDKDNVTVGKPLVKNAKIAATVVSHGRDKKVMVFKKKRRKDYKVKKGHRQDFTEIRIDSIVLGATPKKAAPKEKTAAEQPKETKPKAPAKADAKKASAAGEKKGTAAAKKDSAKKPAASAAPEKKKAAPKKEAKAEPKEKKTDKKENKEE